MKIFNFLPNPVFFFVLKNIHKNKNFNGRASSALYQFNLYVIIHINFSLRELFEKYLQIVF